MSKTPETQAAPSGKSVLIFHTGKGFGPMKTAAGPLLPGTSLEVPEELAAKLTRVYKHIKLASDIIPGGAADPRVAQENAMLKAELEKLSKQLADVNENGPKAIKAAQDEADAAKAEALEANRKLNLAEAGDKVVLQGVVREFLEADSKKALEALQEKHKDIVA